MAAFRMTSHSLICLPDTAIPEIVNLAFRRSVIPAIALAAHQAGHAKFGEFVLKGVAGILTAPIGVMHQTGLTPDEVYQTATGGGACIVDKYGKTEKALAE